jgi:chromosome segregation ATPase
MAEVKNIANGELIVNVDKIIGLEKRIEDSQQTIGSYREQVKNLQMQISDLKQSHAEVLEKLADEYSEKEERLGKEIKVVKGEPQKHIERTCKNCGYSSTNHHTWCPNCDCSSWKTKELITGANVTYKNLEDVVADIKKDVSKNLKLDAHKLEQEIEDLKISNDKLYKENGRFKTQKEQLKKDHAEDLTEAKSEVRNRYQKMLDAKEEKIAELYEEIDNLKVRMTDEIIEENRKQEIVDLKNRIEELETEMAEVEKAAESRKGFKAWAEKRAERRLLKDAIAEAEEKSARINEIGNNYSSSKNQWDFIKIGNKKFRNPFRKSWDDITARHKRSTSRWLHPGEWFTS